jgi:hypothetical protein
MNLQVPGPIATYLAAEAAHDPTMLADCFADDALVYDESHDYRGLDAIIAWKRDAQIKYQYTMEALDTSVNGETVQLHARLAGNFLGSPADVTYTFTLAGDKIAALEIE